jgi:uncharacterized membrane protein
MPPVAEIRIESQDSRDPVRVLALAGGGALLLGLVCFVAYAIEQNWLAPGVRFVLAAIASALLTLAAWPIARRGYDAVAGAIGGAGLGGWFAAFLISRHTHELVSVPQAFAALAVGAAACLAIADRLRLRLMAGLATVAACATPLLVGSDARLHELLIYQLLVIVGLMILDARRRWAELPTIGLLATWLLAGSWATHNHVDEAFVAWSVLLLAVSAGSAWRLVHELLEHTEQAHACVRLLVAGLASWAATAAAFGVESSSFALATALACAWQLGLATFLHRREREGSELFLALGAVQAFVLGPVLFEQAMLAYWWIAMSVAATVVPWTGLRRQRGALISIPALAAVGISVAAEQPWSPFVALLAAAVLLAASLWLEHRPVPWLAITGTIAWSVVVFTLGPTSILAQLPLALIPVAVMASWACAQPTEQAQLLAITHLGLGLFATLAAVLDSEALLLRATGNAGERLGFAVLLLLLAAFGVALIARAPKQRWTGTGLLIATSVGLALLLVVALLSAGSVALGQVGYSLSVAGVGLGLIVAGLRLDDGTWRQLGLAALAVAAAKILLLDLAAAAVGWRALSFVGLGAILIGGSFAYSRASRRACASP